MGVNLFKKFSLTQASEFQIKEILQLLESQSSVQIIANENNTNAIYYKIEIQSVLSNKLLLKYLNQYPNLEQKWFVLKFTRLHGYVERKEHLTEIRLCKTL
jgi:hypothetical protein